MLTTNQKIAYLISHQIEIVSFNENTVTVYKYSTNEGNLISEEITIPNTKEGIDKLLGKTND